MGYEKKVLIGVCVAVLCVKIPMMIFMLIKLHNEPNRLLVRRVVLLYGTPMLLFFGGLLILLFPFGFLNVIGWVLFVLSILVVVLRIGIHLAKSPARLVLRRSSRLWRSH